MRSRNMGDGGLGASMMERTPGLQESLGVRSGGGEPIPYNLCMESEPHGSDSPDRQQTP